MRILVTGGHGFVGGSLVRYLAAQADVARVIAADLEPPDVGVAPPGQQAAAKITTVRLDVTDEAAVTQVLAGYDVTHVIHAAAITASGAEELAHARATVHVNIGGTVTVLGAAAAQPGVARLLLVSSGGVYGAPQADRTRPQREDEPLRPDNFYALSKYSAELAAKRLAEVTAKPIAAVRLPGIYGPLERVRASRPHVSVFFHLRQAMLRGETVKVAGGAVARDWTYAGDVSGAVHALLGARQWRHDVYNVGCGRLASFADVVAAFAAHGLRAAWAGTVREADIAMLPAQARRPLSIERLQEETGFAPRYDVQAGVTAWLRAEGGLSS